MPAASGQSFTFAGQGGNGTYQFQLVSGPGSVTAAGLYSAGTSSGTATIQVTDGLGATATATVKSVFVRTNGPVYSVVSDGTSWYLGGRFNAVNAYQTPGIAVLNPIDGTPNLGCDLQDGFDGTVLTTASDGTSVYVGGDFAHFRGTETPGGLVRIDPVTCRVVRTYFLPTDDVKSTSALFVSGNSLLINAYGPRYLGGQAATSAGHMLIRIDTATGNRDPQFQVTLPIQELPRIYATATAVYAGIYKLNATTGAMESDYHIPFNSTVNAFVAAGNALYLGGFFGGGEGSLRKVDLATGDIDPGFDPLRLVDGYVYDLALVGNSLYVAGSFTQYGNDTVNGLVKVDATTGVRDAAFAPAASFLRNIADGGAHAVLHDNGALYVTGNFMLGGGTPATHIARLDAGTGAIDTTFTKAAGLSDTGLTLTKVGNSLFVGGKFVAYRGTAVSNLAKLNMASGIADPAFTNIGTDGLISALALHGADLYLAGEFQHYNGASAQYLAKVGANSAALDTNFTQPMAGTNLPLSNLAASDTGLFISGDFILYRGQVQHGFAKLNYSDGAVDSTFVNGFTDGFAGPIGVHGSKVYTSSSSSHYGTLVYPAIVRLDTVTGVADASFPGVGLAGGSHVAITFSGSAGYMSTMRFNSGGGNPASTILKFDTTSGVVDTSFAAAFDSVFHPIYALRAVGSSLYVAASPEQYPASEYEALFLTKLDASTGAMDTAFSQPSKTTNGPMRVVESTGTDLWVGGDFTRYRGAPANYFVRVDPVTGALAEP
jgi:hypothetical protein